MFQSLSLGTIILLEKDRRFKPGLVGDLCGGFLKEYTNILQSHIFVDFTLTKTTPRPTHTVVDEKVAKGAPRKCVLWGVSELSSVRIADTGAVPKLTPELGSVNARGHNAELIDPVGSESWLQLALAVKSLGS